MNPWRLLPALLLLLCGCGCGNRPEPAATTAPAPPPPVEEKIRKVFIAIDLDDPLERVFNQFRLDHRRDCESINWERASKLHLTLAFLGEITDSQLDKVKQVCREVVRRRGDASGVLKLRGLGAFPDWDQPRVVWAGVEPDSFPLQAELAAALTAAGFPLEAREFKAHLTLGRPRARAIPAAELAVIRKHLRDDFGLLLYTAIVIYESRGGNYYPLATINLTGEDAPSSPGSN